MISSLANSVIFSPPHKECYDDHHHHYDQNEDICDYHKIHDNDDDNDNSDDDDNDDSDDNDDGDDDDDDNDGDDDGFGKRMPVQVSIQASLSIHLRELDASTLMCIIIIVIIIVMIIITIKRIYRQC